MKVERPLVRVVKVGGSLLDWPELPHALKNWLATESGSISVLICGGGSFVEGIRDASRAHSINQEVAHWLAIDCMTVTARLLATVCQLELVEEYSQLLEKVRTAQPCTVVCDPREFMINHEPSLPGCSLLYDWTATSDSIAARVAAAIQAGELVLLKSQAPSATSLAALAARGCVDEQFVDAVAGLPALRILNLRDANAPTFSLRS